VPAKELILNQNNDRERHSPVSEQGDEIADNSGQVLTTSDSKDSNNDSVGQRPDETGDSVEVVSEQLQGQAGGVVDSDVISNNGEDEEDEAELREMERVEGFSEQTAESVVLVCGCEDGVGLR
jgi:hypothetical protein